MTSGLWVVGAGGHGAVVAEAAQAAGWSDIRFFDDRWPTMDAARSWPVVGDWARLCQALQTAERQPTGVVVAIGDNVKRLEIAQALIGMGAPLTTVIHPHSTVSPTASLGPGTVVLAGAVLNAGAKVGLAGIVNTRASVDHDCTIGDAVHVCPGATLAGNVTLEDLVWFGLGSCAIQGVKVGRGATVGAGATVIGDVRPSVTVVGCPAREVARVG